ncbi:MAG: EAL domain-containing protein, partial [Gammaproteobacteria bacterium]
DDIKLNTSNPVTAQKSIPEVSDILNKFELFYQPIVEMTNYQVQSVEALIHLKTPGKPVSSDQISIQQTPEEQTHLFYWMMLSCFAQLRTWLFANRKLAININVIESALQDEQFLDKISRLMGEYDINPNLIHLEISEQTIMNLGENAYHLLTSLKSLGLMLVLDEFHFSSISLQNIMQLPFDEVKMAPYLINDLAHVEAARRIVKSIIDMSHNFDKLVGASGIESADTWHFLNQNTCDYGQGYFLCKPLPVQEFNNWLGICC